MLEATWAAISTPPRLERGTVGYIDAPIPGAQLTLTFSAPLTAVPVVHLGGRPIAMTAEGAKPGKPILTATFHGPIPVAQLAEGENKLVVDLSADTKPHGRLDRDPTTVPILLSPATERWRNVESGPDRTHAIAKDLEVHRAVRTLDGLLAKLRKGAAESEVRYGSGNPDSNQGWGGMSRSVEKAHERIGAPVQGDPHGQVWLRYNALGLKGAGAGPHVQAATRFRDWTLRPLSGAMKRMDGHHRAYLEELVEKVGRWEEAQPQLDVLSREWLDTRAKFTKLSLLEDEAERQRHTQANQASLDRVEKELRALLPAPLAPFEEWSKARTKRPAGN